MKCKLPGRTLILVLGAFSGLLPPGLVQRAPAVALLGYVCWTMLWGFGGLLLLPALSRKAVFAADRSAADSGCDPRDWVERFPRLVGEDGSSKSAVHNIFYPILSASLRLRQLEKPLSGFVPSNLIMSRGADVATFPPERMENG